MIYKNLIINKNANKKILSFHKMNRLPNAFIFHGNAGSGKEAHAIEFFSLLNCKNPAEESSCGTCNSCIKTKILQHEFLNIIIPLPRSKKNKKEDFTLATLTEKQRDELLEQFKLKSENPYYKIHINKANTILTSSIKDIKRNINLSIPDNHIKLYLIFEAEKLCFPNQEAANALLKILEEPKKNHLFILVTSNLEKIIDTIKSRCVSIYFSQLENSKIESYIKESSREDSNYSKVISQICQGNVSYAIELTKTFKHEIDKTKKMLIYLDDDDFISWNNIFNKNKKIDLIKTLNLLNLFFSYLSKLELNKEELPPNIFNELSKIYLVKYRNINWALIKEIINNCQNYILKNGYTYLCIMSLFIEIRFILNNKYFSEFNVDEWILFNE